MSKIIEATCNALGIITADEFVVEEAETLSLGTKASTGVLLMEDDLVKYLTSNATDIQDLINRLVPIVDKISTIASGLDAVTTSPGGQTANIAALQVLKTDLDASKAAIK